jgi:hypothetical protein
MKNSLLFALAKAGSPKLGRPSQERWLIWARHFRALTAWASATATSRGLLVIFRAAWAARIGFKMDLAESDPRPGPQPLRDLKRLNPLMPPPYGLVSGAVQLVVMDGAEGDCELIADLERETARLGEGQVMGMAGHLLADQAGL